jgi:antitoxin component YwqK of YwqJK toxin-antitoxin module
MCRLDDYWVVTLYLVDYANKKIAPEPPPALRASARSVWVQPPANHTGQWTTYFVNGQKAHEIQYRAGKYDGPFTAFHDDGSKAYQQHYKAGVCHGTDTGWHRNGQKAYEGIYEHGKQIGTWRWWDEAGKVTSEKTFTEPTP